jgi:glucose dehydrogenase
MVGQRLLALKAATGQPDTTFGKDGFVDTGQTWNGVPLVFKNVVVLGVYAAEVTLGDIAGDTRAFDARTGDKLWSFTSVAQPGDPNHAAAWLDDGWKKRQGVNHWGWYFTADEQRDIVYTTFGSPAGNYWGGDRPGTNLYANSVVAVDANTGKYLWHFQSVHHDLWDSDQPAAPTLIDIKQNGRTIPALGLISKTAWLFILDRTTGRPIFGVEERPVPKGDAPGEWYSPTQPFPLNHQHSRGLLSGRKTSLPRKTRRPSMRKRAWTPMNVPAVITMRGHSRLSFSTKRTRRLRARFNSQVMAEQTGAVRQEIRSWGISSRSRRTLPWRVGLKRKYRWKLRQRETALRSLTTAAV